MLFSKSPFLVALIVTVIVILAALSAADDSKDKEECAQPLTGLATCLPYIGGTAKAPTPDCCSGLKELVKTNKKCLCFAVKDRDDPDLGLKINVTLALGLPQLCRTAPVNISECPTLLGLPPNSPEAKDFYQLDKNSSSGGGIISPVAGGPTAPRTTAPLGGTGTGTTPHSQNHGVRINGISFPFLPVLFCAVCALFVIIS